MLRAPFALLLLLLPVTASAQVEVRRGGAEARRIERLIGMSGVHLGHAPVPFRDRRRIHPHPRHVYPDVYEYVPSPDPQGRAGSVKADSPREPGDPAWEEFQLDRYGFSSPAGGDVERAPRAYEYDPGRELDKHHRYRYRNAYRHWIRSDDLFQRSYPYGRFDTGSGRGRYGPIHRRGR